MGGFSVIRDESPLLRPDTEAFSQALETLFPGYLEGDHQRTQLRALADMDPLTPELDAMLEEPRENHRRGGVYHPSDLPYCALRLYHWRLGDADPLPHISAKTLKRFDLGHAVHDMIQKYLERKYKEDFTREVHAVYAPLHIYGNTDGLLRSRARLVEIKSRGSDALLKTSHPDEAHLFQGNTYQFCLDIPVMSYIYVDVSTSGSVSWVEFVERFNTNVWEAVLTKILNVEYAVNRREPPQAAYNHFTCPGCPFLHVCTEGQRGGLRPWKVESMLQSA